jgi:hypothetical protein
MYKKIYYAIIGFMVIIILLLITSCRKFVEVKPGAGQVMSEDVFSTDATALAAVNGLYLQMAATTLGINNGGLSVYAGLSSDELYNPSPNTTLDPFTTNSLSANTSTVNNSFWLSAYKQIFIANLLVEETAKSHKLTSPVKNQLKGEALVVRSLNYFNLVNLFGDVPLVLTTDYTISQSLPRSQVISVYEQVIKDLQEAKDLLPSAYPTAGRIRANKWAATALLARVYLYRGEWEKAEKESSEVIGSSAYSLLQDLNNVFLTNNNEAIWQLARDNANTAEGAAFIPSSASAKPTYAIQPALVNLFDANDKRKTAWMKANTVSGQQYYYPYKYKSRVSTPLAEYLVILRLAEQYLLRAEARAEQGKLPEALQDLNMVRARAGLTSFNSNDKQTILNEIEKERRRELFAEWGHRWFDLKRKGKADSVLSVSKTTWQPYAALYPIPSIELERNTFLIQNPGY